MGSLSIVIPVLDERDSIVAVLEEVQRLWSAGALPKDLEVIVVDDGSGDGTGEAIFSFSARVNLHVVTLKRTFGQTHALNVGIRRSKGEVVVAMDGDGQNDPADISALVERLEKEGVDCVSGWRRDRLGDKGPRVWISAVANRILRAASGTRVHDFGCTLKAYRGDVIRSLPLYGDMHRLIPFQIELAGGSVSEQVVGHRERFAGRSKYTLLRTFRVAQDIVTAFFLRRFLYRPMHLLGTMGFVSIFVASLGIGASIFLKLFGMYDFVETPILLASSVLLMGGINILGIGLLAELLARGFVAGGSSALPHSVLAQSGNLRQEN